MAELGSITNMDPRIVWPNETGDFTPWLAEHADLLGEALGLDIEITGREVAVGPFSLDLLGRDVVGERVVAIENQLGQTDHTHLGQLLTYAANLDARIVVWISPKVRDEHRETIHWLNSQAGEETGFFAVEIELLRIGESLPAPRFNVVAQPIEFQKSLSKHKNANLTGAWLEYQAFNDDVIQRLADVQANLKVSGRRGPYITFLKIGKKGFRLATSFQRGQFEIELVIQKPDQRLNEAAFDQLYGERVDIEAEIGQQLEWDRDNYGRKASRAFVSRPGTIKSPVDEIEEFKRWAVDLLPRFRDAFQPRIAALDLDALAAEAFEYEEDDA